MIYPVDYGFLSDTFGSDQNQLMFSKGSIATNNVDAIAITADILEKDCIVKLISGLYRGRNNAYSRILRSNRIPKGNFSP